MSKYANFCTKKNCPEYTQISAIVVLVVVVTCISLSVEHYTGVICERYMGLGTDGRKIHRVLWPYV